ncbi:hypothetical protein J6590_086050 [Homalodisca vitripennis]|nr:hypothetical protein J6590_086050 [Homalodisca vitripennis]
MHGFRSVFLHGSRDILSETDGRFFIEQDVIDLAANLYAELIDTAATFGDGSFERLVPHATPLLNKLNDISNNNSDFKQEDDSLRSSILATCGQLEDQYEADISNLNNILAKCREENVALKERLVIMPDHNSNLIQESQTKIEA